MTTAVPVRSLPAILVVAALVLAGCGSTDDDSPDGRFVEPETTPAETATATAPAEQPVTITEQVPAPATQTATAPAPTPTSPEESPGGAGDEEGIQVAARFTLGSGGSLSPDGAQVPAFLGVSVVVDNQDSTAHRLEVGDRGAPLPAGRTTTLNLPGRAATELPVLIDGNQEAILRIVAETALSTLVKDEYGPTLPELLRGVPRWARYATWAGIVIVLAVGLWLGTGGAAAPETHAVVRGDRTFNLAWDPSRLQRVDEKGTLLALEGRRGDLFLDSYTVSSVTLPPYRGAPGGVLAVLGANRLRELRATAPGFVPSNPPEGRTRVNDSTGYQITWRERRDGRTIYARDIWLVDPEPGSRDALLVQLRTTRAAGTPNADRTGGTGALKQPLRSLRFGTERVGGR